MTHGLVSIQSTCWMLLKVPIASVGLVRRQLPQVCEVEVYLMDQVAPHRARVYGRQRRTGLYHLIKNTNSRCSSGCESYDPYVIVQTVGYLASEYHVRSIPASVFLCRTREYKRIQVSILEGTHTSMSCHPPPHKGVASSEWLSDVASRWSIRFMFPGFDLQNNIYASFHQSLNGIQSKQTG